MRNSAGKKYSFFSKYLQGGKKKRKNLQGKRERGINLIQHKELVCTFSQTNQLLKKSS